MIAPYGPVDWVKNLRAAGTASITVRGRPREVIAVELLAGEAGPILRETLMSAGPVVRRVIGPYFETTTDAPAQAWEAEAARHPVFLLRERTRKSRRSMQAGG